MRISISPLLLLFLIVIIHSSGYDPKIARVLAYMSYNAYESQDAINNWSCDKCSKFPLKSVKAGAVQGADLQWFSGYSTDLKAIIISFRGSSSIANWIINLSTDLVSYPKCSGCQVHRGFFTSWQLAQTALLNRVNSLRSLYRNVPIYVTGHSMGGALAALSVC